MISISVQEIINNKQTYPSWTTNSTYPIECKNLGNETLVYYVIKGNRKISRIFPKNIELSPRLSYALGFLKGEGSTSLGKSNYRRLTITNSIPEIIKLVIDELDKNDLFSKEKIIDKSISILHHTLPDEEVIDFWSKQLQLYKSKFRCYDDKSKTSQHGVCHVYISDVLLRRVIDLMHDYFNNANS